MDGDLRLESLRGRSADELVSREWLVTNGLGGYSSGTVLGPLTRKYHGLLVPNLVEPNGRHVLLSTLDESLEVAGRGVLFGGARTPEGVLLGDGAEFLDAFRLEFGMPVWEYRWNGSLLRRRLMMPNGRNMLCVRYEYDGPHPLRLKLRPWMTLRRHDYVPDAHVVQRSEPRVRLVDDEALLEVELKDTPVIMRMSVPGVRAEFTLAGSQQPQLYALEADRGYPAQETLFSPGYFSVELRPGGRCEAVATLAPEDPFRIDCGELFHQEAHRAAALLRQAGQPRDPLVARLVLAADQFIIKPGNRAEEETHATATANELRTVIAGYHWFGDWGRDTMISLEGLTLCTGRHAEAKAILTTFAGYVKDGLLPNLFPEGARQALYHTVDATLWYFHALDRYCTWTGSLALAGDLMPVLESICDHYTNGTHYGIAVDPADGLVREGAPGYQLTWMDAKAGDWVVTPRHGKPVEIQALWHNALRLMADWRAGLGLPAGDYAQRAERVRESFNARYWIGDAGPLYDVIDGPEGNDPSGRPNQVFSMSLRHPVLREERWPAVLDYVEKHLLTPYGLRTLVPGHPDYKPNYHGDLLTRDGAYHQGTVWPWLIGHYVDAWLRVRPATLPGQATGDPLAAFQGHLADFGVGSIAEIFDAEAPYVPRGCIAQAWSVAEVLRARLRQLGLLDYSAAPRSNAE